MKLQIGRYNIIITVVVTLMEIMEMVKCDYSPAKSNREHKVHNIILYPDKHSWCTATPIVQVIGYPGCNSIHMNNSVCVGACFSYVVPNMMPATSGDVTPYCDSCQPDKTTWKQVELDCTEGDLKGRKLSKYVEIITECSCAACKTNFENPFEHSVEESNFQEENNSSLEDAFNATLNVLFPSANTSASDTLHLLVVKLRDKYRKNNSTENEQLEGKIYQTISHQLSAANQSTDLNHFFRFTANTVNESNVDTRILNKTNVVENVSEIPGPHHSLVFAKDSIDMLVPLNLYSKGHSTIDKMMSSNNNNNNNYSSSPLSQVISYHSNNQITTTDVRNND